MKPEARSQKPEAGNPASVFRSPSSEHGVALIITLILLSVTLLMALAFLAISRRAQNAANTATDAASARLAADAALASAEAQIMANILTSTNPYNFGPLVSTNYINPFGYVLAIPTNPTNVCFQFRSDHITPLNPDDFVQNVGNLLYFPRVPVAIGDPNNPSAPLDFRYYLDLNRNGVDDPYTNNQVGDPEWIGMLEHPDQVHGPNNKFTSRWLFFAVPIGNGLDLNYMHNQTLNQTLSVQDGYLRNQNVGSWELNLPAFLADLNTNEWNNSSAPYIYGQPASPNSGVAFDDARALLAYRYGYNYNSLATVQGLFGLNGANAFINDGIDGYSDGPLQTTINTNEDYAPPPLPYFPDNPTLPWAGADNTNHFFDVSSDLFDPTKTGGGGIPSFTNRLLSAAVAADNYDRYTFYRLLSQLGTDSLPESGKLNLNYSNALVLYDAGGVPTNITIIPGAETNFVFWRPLDFFNAAADQLLKTYTTYWTGSYYGQTNFLATFNVAAPFGVTHIPVWVSNRFVYTPAVNRVLQLAANIYDATTNRTAGGSQPDYPDVFRPIFTTTNDNGNLNVFITGYTNVSPMTPTDVNNLMLLDLPVEAWSLSGVDLVTNVNGVPWIIGAKKGFPNFNSFTFENVFGETRKLQVTRQSTNDTYISNPTHYTFSQQITLGITNMLQVECWNSYQAAHTNFAIYATDITWGVITNDEGLVYPISSQASSQQWPFSIPSWPGFLFGSPYSFVQPLLATNLPLPNLIYSFNTNTNFAFYSTSSALFVTNTLMPEWGLQITNRLRVLIVETNQFGTLNVVDYVQLAGPDSSHDVSQDMRNLWDTKINPGYDNQWDTNIVGSLPTGIANQLGVSAAFNPIMLSPYWSGWTLVNVTNTIDGFRGLLGFSYLLGSTSVGRLNNSVGKVSTSMQAPYTPPGLVAYVTRWEANDPLVHYLGSDLTDNSQSTGPFKQFMTLIYGQLNKRYMPWGGNPGYNGTDPNPYLASIKDPQVKNSDGWDFPTGKLPTTGWLGRVHRGTPWQTVYLKSSGATNSTIGVLMGSGTNLVNLWTWQYWTGNMNFFDASNSVPTQDRLLFDVFTAKLNDNATRGQLSVNVPPGSLAAWSAMFSGMVVPTSLTNSYTVIQPAGVYDSTLAWTNTSQPPLLQIAGGIDQSRANYTNADGTAGVYEHVGSILRTPQLSEQSPFLAGIDPSNNISDQMYEWLPQQMMSLVRVGSPRYVIYSYGQALKPAPGGIYSGTANTAEFGLVTNYQVVAEIATRAVVRFDATVTNVPAFDQFGNPTVQTVVTNNRAVIESFNILPPD